MHSKLWHVVVVGGGEMFGFGRARRLYSQEVDRALERLLKQFPEAILAPARATVDIDGVKRNWYKKHRDAPVAECAVYIACEIVAAVIDRMSHEFKAEAWDGLLHPKDPPHPFFLCLRHMVGEAEATVDELYVKFIYAVVEGTFSGRPRDVILNNWGKQSVYDIIGLK